MQPDQPSVWAYAITALDRCHLPGVGGYYWSGCEDARAQAAWAGRGEARRWRAWACGPIWCRTPTSVYCIKTFLARKESVRKFHICLRQIYRSFFLLWIFYDVWKHQSCGMKWNNRAVKVLNKMNLKLFRLFLFTFMWEWYSSLNYLCFP